LASSLDHAGLTGVIGTIAGDDTIFLVSKKATGGALLAKELLAYAQADGKRK
jgi:transcriptional regulator of arginine metabolism